MRVLQVCPYDLARPGGVQRHILDLSAALADAGHDVTIVAPAPAHRDGAGTCGQPRDGVEVVQLGYCRAWRMHGTRFELTWAPSDALRAFAAKRGDPIDVAHFHAPHVPFMPWRLSRRIRGRARRTVATFHDTPPPGLSGRIARAAFGLISRRLSERLDALIPVSESAGAHLRAAPQCAIARLPPCIDLRPYASLPARAQREGDAPVVLFVGRLEPRKGVLLLIDAFARVRRAFPQARLIVCGDGEERAAARAAVQAAGIDAAVRFTGQLAEADKLALYDKADVFCAPSPYGESYGLVIAEAMAAGVPVVAAANPGYSALLTGEGAAGLVEPGSASALAEGLRATLASRELQQRLSQWGRQMFRQSDVTARLPDFLAVYAA